LKLRPQLKIDDLHLEFSVVLALFISIIVHIRIAMYLL